MMIVGDAVATTVTEFDTVAVLPAVSVMIAVTLYEPETAYTCETVVAAEIGAGPRCNPVPSGPRMSPCAEEKRRTMARALPPRSGHDTTECEFHGVEACS